MKERLVFHVICLSLILAPGLACNKESGSTSEPTPGKPMTETPVEKKPVEEQPAVTKAPTTETPKMAATTSAPSTQASGWAPTEKPQTKPRIEMRIQQGSEEWGWIVIELDPVRAPITVANFLRYVDEGYYNGTIFHRVMPDFMIQGGSFVPPRIDKKEGIHDPIQLESENGLKNVKGSIAMARTGDPNSATSGFFINVVDNPNLDYPRPDRHGYAVFGKVVDGDAVVERIRKVQIGPSPDNPREISSPANPPMIAVAQRVK